MTWEMTDPVSTYLVAFAVGSFVTIPEEPLGDVTLEYFTFADKKTATEFDFATTRDMIAFYSSIFPYGFPRYAATVAWARTGGMEHQTNSLIGESTIRGDRTFEFLFAHEAAHQWWGDLVTLESWNHIWLNEGFATYFDLLYAEHAYGEDHFQARLKTLQDVYVWGDSLRVARGLSRNAILHMPADRVFSFVVYNKGASVLHMIRGLSLWESLGSGFFTREQYAAARGPSDERFFRIFEQYAAAHAYANANSADFQAVCEDVLVQDLDWFFDPWLEDPGHPDLVIGVDQRSTATGTRVQIRIQQVQRDGAPVFRMPVHVRYNSIDTERQEVRWLKGEVTQWSVDLPRGAWTVTLDPDNWLLEKQTRGDFTGPVDVVEVPASPNPSASGFQFRYDVSGEGVEEGLFRVFDSRGRLVRRRDVGFLAPGQLQLRWDGLLDDGRRAPAGVYFARLTLGTRSFSSRLVVLP